VFTGLRKCEHQIPEDIQTRFRRFFLSNWLDTNLFVWGYFSAYLLLMHIDTQL